MSDDGNACGSHLQFKQPTTNPTVDWRAPNTEAFNATSKNTVFWNTLKFALPFDLDKWPAMQNSDINTCRIHCRDMKGS